MNTVANYTAVEEVTVKNVFQRTAEIEDVVSKDSSFPLNGDNCIVVYNPYNPEALVAAAILKGRFDEEAHTAEALVRMTASSKAEANAKVMRQSYKKARFVTHEEIIDNDGANYIWLGVKRMRSTGNNEYSKNTAHFQYGSDQPFYTVERTLGIIDKLLGKKPITAQELRANALIEYVDGPYDPKLPWLQNSYVTLIDKVMFDFRIEDDGRGLRYHASKCKGWAEGKLTPEEEAGYYCTLRAALLTLEQNVPFKVFRGDNNDLDNYAREVAFRFKNVSNKATTYRVSTAQGTQNVSIISAPPELFHLATRHFNNIGSKYLAMSSGMNGRFFYGNVMVTTMSMFKEKFDYIDF